jgi:hypothetical protein
MGLLGSLGKKEVASSSREIGSEAFIKKWISQSEKVCGRSPKNMRWHK